MKGDNVSKIASSGQYESKARNNVFVQPVPLRSIFYNCCSSQIPSYLFWASAPWLLYRRILHPTPSHRAALPASKRATSTWKFTFLLPPQDIFQPMPNSYKEIKTHLPRLDECWINSGEIHIPKFLCSIQLRLVFILKWLSSLAPSLSLSLFLHSFTGSLGSTSLITHWLINYSLRCICCPRVLKHPPTSPIWGKYQ